MLLIILASLVALPPLILHVFLHPFTYLVSSSTPRKRLLMIRSKFFYYAWRIMSPLFASAEHPVKTPLYAKASGTVLEVGPGMGANMSYYTSKVTRIILVEPNADMHPALRKKANKAGYWESDGSLLLLGCGGGISDERALNLAGVGLHSVDTIITINVLCGIPSPAEAIEMYRRLLKPGGLLIFYEHVRSEEQFSADCQTFYTRTIWPSLFDGCCLDRPIGAWIIAGPDAAQSGKVVIGEKRASSWEEGHHNVQKRWADYHVNVPDGQAKFALLPHIGGWAVTAS